MEIKRIALGRVRLNEENPREIGTEKFRKLVDSVLVLPKMLEIRPVVVDERMVALGGNMRLAALKEIAKMSEEALMTRLTGLADYTEMPEGRQAELANHWSEWLKGPDVPVIDARELTMDEREQFVIKDNVSYGQWDYEALANKWDERKIESWGVDVWINTNTAEPEDLPTGEEGDGVLPPELQGRDLTPNELAKIQGADETPNEYVMITYEAGELWRVADLLGVSEGDLAEKICWTVGELDGLRMGR